MPLRPFTALALLFALTAPAFAVIAPRPPVEPPDCPPGYTYRWVPAVYQAITERIWVPEREQQVEYWVQITPDRWERRWRTITIPAHYETVTRRELVREGYWQLVRIDRWPPTRPVYSNPPTVGVEGYSRQPTEDLSKFSSLSEWPDKK